MLNSGSSVLKPWFRGGLGEFLKWKPQWGVQTCNKNNFISSSEYVSVEKECLMLKPVTSFGFKRG